MENLKEKIEELLKTKIIKVNVIKVDDNKENEYQISVTFNGNLIEMKSLFDLDVYDDELNKLGIVEHYEKYGKCRKDIPYEEKVKIFEDNITSMLINSTFIGQITKQNLSDVYELLKNENVLVPYLNIFRYKDMVMCMGETPKNDNFEHGKYTILTANEITQFLEKGYIIFLYTVFDTKYNTDDKLKYKCVILDENVN